MRRGKPVTGWRRIASAMWSNPDDPQIFGWLDVDARPTLQFIARAREAGHHLTETHLVGRALAHALLAVPDLNVQLRRGRVIPRDTIDIFFITSVAHGRDLSGVKVTDVPKRSAIEIAAELAERASALKGGRDREFSKTKRFIDRLPPRLLRPLLRATLFLADDLGIDVPMLALHPHPFGSAMVSSVGMFGLPNGLVPIAWMYDVPLLMLVGQIAVKPAVVDGRVEAVPMIPVTATIDHRYVDGWHVSQLLQAFREYLAAPELFEPAVGLHAA